MKIETVEIQGNGYFLNGEIFVPKEENNPLYKLVLEYIGNGGKIKQEVTKENTKIYMKSQSDLASSDIQIQYHDRQSSRAIGNIYDWYAYQEALRDIASLKDGIYKIYDLSEEQYIYDGVDYTRPLDDNGYPIKPTEEN